jgi:hypothetical protein
VYVLVCTCVGTRKCGFFPPQPVFEEKTIENFRDLLDTRSMN